MNRKHLILALLIFVLASPALAQNHAQIYKEGVEALYSLDFSAAKAYFRQLTTMEPQDPAGWNHLASAMWLEIVAAQEKLDMESFSGAGIGTNGSQDVVSAEAEKELRSTIQTAISKADARLKQNPHDVAALYAKGVAKGTLAAFEGVAKENYFRALSCAREARDLHREVLNQDPSFTDAKLTLGLYDYVVGSIPRALRIVLLLWSGGDKTSGIVQVREVTQKGIENATDAKLFLVVIYNREKHYQDSLALLSQLHAQYPRNYLFELSSAEVYAHLKEFDLSLSAYQDVLAKIEARRDGYERIEAPKVLLLIAKNYVDNNKLKQAQEIWERVINDARSTDTDRANARLWIGNFDDASGNRAKALAQYDAILALNASPRLKQEAEKYKKRPFKF